MTKTCKVYGDKFFAKRRDRKTCSDSCRRGKSRGVKGKRRLKTSGALVVHPGVVPIFEEFKSLILAMGEPEARRRIENDLTFRDYMLDVLESQEEAHPPQGNVKPERHLSVLEPHKSLTESEPSQAERDAIRFIGEVTGVDDGKLTGAHITTGKRLRDDDIDQSEKSGDFSSMEHEAMLMLVANGAWIDHYPNGWPSGQAADLSKVPRLIDSVSQWEVVSVTR